MKRFDTSKQFHVLKRILVLRRQNVNLSIHRVEIKVAKQTLMRASFSVSVSVRIGLQSPNELKDFCGTVKSDR